MSFTDDFTGSSGDKLDGRTGWAIEVGEGARNMEIHTTGTTLITATNGGGAGETIYSCTDQADADHSTQIKLVNLSADAQVKWIVRYVDNDNYVYLKIHGTGATGLRMTKRIAGSETDMVTMQGVAGDTYRVSVTGTQYGLYYDSGSVGSFAQSGSDQTVSDGDLSTSETTQGVRTFGTGSTEWDDFEAIALGGGGGATVPAAAYLNNKLNIVRARYV